jgi:hypothetical protein
MAVSAGGQAGHHGFGLGLVDVAELPLDFGEDGVGQGLNDAALRGFRWWRDQGDIAIEEGSADGVAGGSDGGLFVRDGLIVFLGGEAADDDGGWRADGVLFDFVPGFWVRAPGVVEGFFWRERRWDVAVQSFVERTKLHFFAGGPGPDRFQVLAKDDFDTPDCCGEIIVAPLKLWRDDVGRVDCAIDGYVDVQTCVGSVHGNGAEVFGDDAGIVGCGGVLRQLTCEPGRNRACENNSGGQQQGEGREKDASHQRSRKVPAKWDSKEFPEPAIGLPE